jgi:ADP-dependent NAD(P)H-hydrate dehydratase / NAD(P)H-hydrate epimerase
MIPVLSRGQMRAFDKHAIETCHVPGVILMENAGRGAADVLSAMIEAERCVSKPRRARARHANPPGEHAAPSRAVASRELEASRYPTRHLKVPGQPAMYPLEARVVVVCGAGNNGGDGFVVARHLLARGAEVSVILAGSSEKVTGDARIMHDAFIDLGGLCIELPSGSSLDPLTAELAQADYVVDALFGTGLDRPIQGHLLGVIAAINDAHARVVALDIPSGLDADSGAPLGTAVQADDTVTFCHLKVGLLTPEGARLAGNVHVVDLGVPDARILEHVGHIAEVIDRAHVGRAIRPREANVHKHAAGNVLVIAGSEGKLGAAMLAARSAMRGGAGLVTICTWPDANRALASKATEIMTAKIDPQRIEASLDVALEGRHVVAIGPGLGLDSDAQRAVNHVVLGWDGVKVVDADAITHFAGRPEALAGAKGKLILTPHPGELGRLLGLRGGEIERDRVGAVRKAVDLTRATIVLKGARTLIATPSGELHISMAGNPVLATAGSGDVLTGIIAALACVMEHTVAASSGVLLHGLAADRWRERTGSDRGLLAGELADLFPELMAELSGS